CSRTCGLGTQYRVVNNRVDPTGRMNPTGRVELTDRVDPTGRVDPTSRVDLMGLVDQTDREHSRRVGNSYETRYCVMTTCCKLIYMHFLSSFKGNRTDCFV